jgi:hypothetical protein
MMGSRITISATNVRRTNARSFGTGVFTHMVRPKLDHTFSTP